MICLAGIITLMAIAVTFITRYFENEITERISLNNGKANSIKVDLFSRSLKVTDFEWNSDQDSINKKRHRLKAKLISLTRLSLIN